MGQLQVDVRRDRSVDMRPGRPVDVRAGVAVRRHDDVGMARALIDMDVPAS